MTPARRLKQALVARQPMLVVNIDYSNASLVSFLADRLADVIFIDCEQGDTSIETVPDLVRAAHLMDTPVLLRVPDGSPATVERYLLRGVDGIVVPRLDTAEQARAVVATVEYCFNPGAIDKAVVIQIESAAAARRIDAFLAIDKIDAFFIGPVDLSRSMGFGGDFRGPEVRGEVERLIARIVRSGRSAGMLVDHRTISALVERGVSFLYLHANDFLIHGATPFTPFQGHWTR